MKHAPTPASPAPRPARRRLLRAAAALVAAPLAARASGRPIEIHFSHVVAPETAKGRAAEHFRKLAEARSGHRVRVVVHPDSRLYKDREELDALRLGAVQMLAPSLSKLAGVGGGDFEVFDLPFMFASHAGFRAVADGPVGAGLLRRLEASGIRGLAFWDNGFKVFSANRPLRDPADFKGLRFRVQASRTLVEQMRALGATASVSPLTHVFDALRLRELDGQENVPTNIATQRLHEVQTHLTVSNHGYLAYAVIVNRVFWERLPADIRAVLEDALREATAFANAQAESGNREALARIEQSGHVAIHRPDAQALAQWRRAMTPVHEATRGWISPATVAAVRQVAGASP